MKKLLLWLVMVVVMLAALLGGAGYAMYAMTSDDKLPAQHPTLGGTELEPVGYDWSVPVLGNVLNRTFEQPSTLTVQKLGEMTETAPELVLPDWAQRTALTLKDPAGSVVVQGDAAAYAAYAYPQNGSYELTLTVYRSTADPGDATGWYRYSAVSASARAAWRRWWSPASWTAASRPWKPTWAMCGSALSPAGIWAISR